MTAPELTALVERLRIIENYVGEAHQTACEAADAIESLAQRCDAAQREIAELENENAVLNRERLAFVDEYNAQGDKYARRTGALRMALLKYGKHDLLCIPNNRSFAAEGECTCGLDAALSP